MKTPNTDNARNQGNDRSPPAKLDEKDRQPGQQREGKRQPQAPQGEEEE